MAEPFISQILTVAFPWAPEGWAQCNGQNMPVRQYAGLFTLIGVQFGGDGVNVFKLPDFAGRTLVGCGADAWGNQYSIGAGKTGPVSVGLGNMPSHSHAAVFTPSPAASSVALQSKLDLPLSGTLSGGLGSRNVGGGDNTPTSPEVLGISSVQVYAPSGGTAVPLAKLNLEGTLTGSLNPGLTVTAAVPPAAGAVTLQSAGTTSSPALPAPYLVQTVIIATQGIWPTRP